MAMINCPECGKPISDKAQSCPHCGYPIAANANQWGAPVGAYPYAPPINAMNSPRSSLYPQIRAFADEVKTIYVLGILSIVCCLGIGLIFEIINLVKIKKLTVPDTKQISVPYEMAEYTAAARQLQTAKKLTGIAFIITGIALFALFILTMIAIQI